MYIRNGAATMVLGLVITVAAAPAAADGRMCIDGPAAQATFDRPHVVDMAADQDPTLGVVHGPAADLRRIWLSHAASSDAFALNIAVGDLARHPANAVYRLTYHVDGNGRFAQARALPDGSWMFEIGRITKDATWEYVPTATTTGSVIATADVVSIDIPAAALPPPSKWGDRVDFEIEMVEALLEVGSTRRTAGSSLTRPTGTMLLDDTSYVLDECNVVLYPEALPDAAPVMFDSLLLWSMRPEATATAVGDVTGDGRTDALVMLERTSSHTGAGELWIYPNRAEGPFAAPIRHALEYPTASDDPLSVVAGDFDGDGLDDAAVATEQGVNVWLQRSGVLTDRRYLPVPGGANDLVVTDLDDDGTKDLIVRGTQQVTWVRGTPQGLGEAAPVVQLNGLTTFELVAAGDVNNDGRVDLATRLRNVHDTFLGTFLQQPDGTFDEQRRPRPSGEYTVGGIDVGDVTGDGLGDVVISSHTSEDPTSRVEVYAQTPDGSLAHPVARRTYPFAGPIAVIDMNNDGRRDVVTAHDDGVGLLLQNRDGTLSREQRWTLPDNSGDLDLAVADMTGDAQRDVVLSARYRGLYLLTQAPRSD